MFIKNKYGYNTNKTYEGYKMIVLNREKIIDGLIELKKEEELTSEIIFNNIKSIVNLDDVSNQEKLKLINNELGKILFN
jgi:hypothetical protein